LCQGSPSILSTCLCGPMAEMLVMGDDDPLF
jgi:hypothetical protein